MAARGAGSGCCGFYLLASFGSCRDASQVSLALSRGVTVLLPSSFSPWTPHSSLLLVLQLCKSPPHRKWSLIFMLLNSNNKSLLASCRLSQIGRFFGEVDGSIMASLLKMGMFKKYDWLKTYFPLMFLFILKYVGNYEEQNTLFSCHNSNWAFFFPECRCLTTRQCARPATITPAARDLCSAWVSLLFSYWWQQRLVSYIIDIICCIFLYQHMGNIRRLKKCSDGF